MPTQHALIIGGGIAGAAAALALTQRNRMTCSIFEIRSEPATIGGAINLTPNAMRYLEHLGVLPRLKPKGCEVKYIDILSLRTGQPLGKINFDNIEKFKHHALRVMRDDLLQSMLQTLKEAGVDVQYGMKVQSVIEANESISAVFEDGTTVKGDILLGCDGIHSAIRTKFIDPSRMPEYTGVACAYDLLDAGDLREIIPIESTSLYTGGFGSLLLSYTNAAKTRLYISAVMGTEDVGSREGWAIKGQDQEAMKQDLLRRFRGPTLPFLEKLLSRTDSLVLYPVFKISDNGPWTSGRMLLLGDAAHAMPPQGESVGLALEDVMLLSRVLEHCNGKSVEESFQLYDKLRRPRINAAVKMANFGFETVKRNGWFKTILIEWITWIFLAFTSSRKEREFAYDVRDIDLDCFG
ncbi:FAD/NAD(P)-binding domain-containing protein [Westerdykella ornata]|uniref:FAD/NAD(P)-binding domain-containing protein n=1 Tax=Westerdykella ornata TaxID=318751 RepID=A0A6A6J6A6_WESOR|nr:FAD/NAD(P)-binding domain-containing protein [Westerdykella ornata]KAF2272111.1 FAD/NAD(P)-binding domain-containing protein [Westerdykella ornata]